jgi:hypothetical protein
MTEWFAPDQDLSIERKQQAVLESATNILENMQPHVRQKIAYLLAQTNRTQFDIADEMMAELRLPDFMRSAFRLAVNRICAEDLEPNVREDRRLRANRSNREKGRENIGDHRENGKRGGEIRANQFAETGHPAGYELWNDAERAFLRQLIDDPLYRYTTKPHEGKLNFSLVYRAFMEKFPDRARSLTSLRIMARRIQQGEAQ